MSDPVLQNMGVVIGDSRKKSVQIASNTKYEYGTEGAYSLFNGLDTNEWLLEEMTDHVSQQILEQYKAKVKVTVDYDILTNSFQLLAILTLARLINRNIVQCEMARINILNMKSIIFADHLHAYCCAIKLQELILDSHICNQDLRLKVLHNIMLWYLMSGKHDNAYVYAKLFHDEFGSSRISDKYILNVNDFITRYLCTNKNYQDVISFCMKLICDKSTMDKFSTDALYYLAKSYYRLGDYNKCIRLSNKLLEDKKLITNSNTSRGGIRSLSIMDLKFQSERELLNTLSPITLMYKNRDISNLYEISSNRPRKIMV